MKMQTSELVSVLQDIIARIKARDSFEGQIAYTCMEDGLAVGEWVVSGSYRIGNHHGQGGTRILSATTEDL